MSTAEGPHVPDTACCNLIGLGFGELDTCQGSEWRLAIEGLQGIPMSQIFRENQILQEQWKRNYPTQYIITL